MRDRLDALARLIQVGDTTRSDDDELVAIALGRTIDQTLRSERGGRHAKEWLLDEPLAECIVDAVEGCGHHSIMVTSATPISDGVLVGTREAR